MTKADLFWQIYKQYRYSGINPFTLFRLQVFFDEGGHVFLQFGGLQDLDVVGKAQVVSADAFHLIDFGVEVPDVVVALMGHQDSHSH